MISDLNDPIIHIRGYTDLYLYSFINMDINVKSVLSDSISREGDTRPGQWY